MKGLVQRFEKELGISKGEAILRSILHLLIMVFLIGTLTAIVAFFPYADNSIKKISILPGRHVQVLQLVGTREVFVNKNQFLQLTKNKTTFLSPGRDSITYIFVKGKIFYKYKKNISDYTSFLYSVSYSKIKNGILVRKTEMDPAVIITTVVLLVIFISFLLSFLTVIRRKRIPCYSGNVKKYRFAW